MNDLLECLGNHHDENAPTLFMSSIYLPFPNWDHWNFIRTNLFYSPEIDNQRAALRKITDWQYQQPLSHGYDSTLKLLTPLLDMDEYGVPADKQLYFSMTLSLALIRFVLFLILFLSVFQDGKWLC